LCRPTINRLRAVFKVGTPTGALAAFTDAQAQFADLCVKGGRARSSLAMGGRKGHLEDAMGTEAKRITKRNQVIAGVAWAAGIGITLVEMQFGVEYVLSHVVNNMSAIVGWLPMIGVLVKRVWS